MNLGIRKQKNKKIIKSTRRTYLGIEDLPADAQIMLLSLAYNRGASTTGSRHRKMKVIKRRVKKNDIAGIADQFVSMKRLWEDKGLPRLWVRRDKEANLIKKANHHYKKTILSCFRAQVLVKCINT